MFFSQLCCAKILWDSYYLRDHLRVKHKMKLITYKNKFISSYNDNITGRAWCIWPKVSTCISLQLRRQKPLPRRRLVAGSRKRRRKRRRRSRSRRTRWKSGRQRASSVASCAIPRLQCREKRSSLGTWWTSTAPRIDSTPSSARITSWSAVATPARCRLNYLWHVLTWFFPQICQTNVKWDIGPLTLHFEVWIRFKTCSFVKLWSFRMCIRCLWKTTTTNINRRCQNCQKVQIKLPKERRMPRKPQRKPLKLVKISSRYQVLLLIWQKCNYFYK